MPLPLTSKPKSCQPGQALTFLCPSLPAAEHCPFGVTCRWASKHAHPDPLTEQFLVARQSQEHVAAEQQGEAQPQQHQPPAAVEKDQSEAQQHHPPAAVEQDQSEAQQHQQQLQEQHGQGGQPQGWWRQDGTIPREVQELPVSAEPPVEEASNTLRKDLQLKLRWAVQQIMWAGSQAAACSVGYLLVELCCASVLPTSCPPPGLALLTAESSSMTSQQQTACWPPWASATRSWDVGKVAAAARAAEMAAVVVGRQDEVHVLTRGQQHVEQKVLSRRPSGSRLIRAPGPLQLSALATMLLLWMGWAPQLTRPHQMQQRQRRKGQLPGALALVATLMGRMLNARHTLGRSGN